VRPLYSSHTGVAIAFYALLGVFLLLEQRTRVRSLLNRSGARRDQGSLHLLIVCIGAGVAGAFVLAFDVGGASLGSARWPLLGCGLVLMAAGIVLRQWAIALLGRFFTVDVRVQEGQQVIDTGPYRWVRHPSYTGMLLTFIGIGLCLGNWLSLLCVLVLPNIGLLVRIHVEEAALLTELGEPYRRFAAERARLIPHIW
jgi:protein-S-isoprenylcysteine O-methyltransferase Ste14